MKNSFVILACALLLSSCHAVVRTSHRNGVRVEVSNRPMTVQPFERVEVAGSFKVSYEQADSSTVRVAAAQDVMDDLDIRIDGSTLCIGYRDNLSDFHFGRDYDKVDVFITSPDLISVHTAGDVDFKVPGHLDTDDLQLSLAGIGKMDFNNLICDKVVTEIAGSGGVFVKNLTTADARFEIAGSGDIDVHFEKGGSVNVQIAGSGNVRLSGQVKQYKQSIAGSGNIDRKELFVVDK